MNLVRRKGQVVYEDLLRELERLEQQLMPENSAAAMSLMVLEAKLRDRFHQMERQLHDNRAVSADEWLIRDNMSAAELEALIPRDVPALPDAVLPRTDVKSWETVAVAAMLAVATACGVFGLATALQVFLGWIA